MKFCKHTACPLLLSVPMLLCVCVCVIANPVLGRWGMQVTGEATYVDDIPLPANTLYAAVVPSARPHAKLLSVDTSEALKVPSGISFHHTHKIIVSVNE